MKPRPRIRKAALWGSVVVVMLLAAGAFWTLTPMWRDRPIRFDSARWRATPAEDSHASIRQRMVDDLLVSHPLIGLSRPQVEALIGSPDNAGYFREYEMVYMLGQERRSMFAIDSEWLVVKLDKSGRVIEARLVTD